MVDTKHKRRMKRLYGSGKFRQIMLNAKITQTESTIIDMRYQTAFYLSRELGKDVKVIFSKYNK